jgi:hypothetical protein
METNLKAIAINYLSGWFAMDVLATLPFQLFLKAKHTGEGEPAG